MLGGNAEFMAKNEMRKLGYEEEMIGNAVSFFVTEDQDILDARAKFSELKQKFAAEIRPEAERVCELGGLFILGTERHESRRIDNQLRGRSGRQGDPGESRFYLSLEDDLMRLFGSDRIIGLVERMGLDDDTPIDAKVLSGSIETAQKRIEDQNFTRRKNVLTYDDVMNQQRKVIYKQRNDVLDGLDLQPKIRAMIEQCISDNVTMRCASEDPSDWNLVELREYFRGYLLDEGELEYTEEELSELKSADIIDNLTEKALAIYDGKAELFGSEDIVRELERVVLLRNVDEKWMDHLDAMEELKGSIGLHAYAQRDPVAMYRIQGADMFDEMIADIRENTVRMILSAIPKPREEIKRVQVANPLIEGFAGGKAPARKAPAKKAEKVGRNDPCPCGSGKKYKKCCGQNDGAEE